ncbi:MAG: F0F1 ATP synthase subunit delta [Candidatus Dojkabacteria bacterium]|nr:F0F1 ATP synthase subunit delta [Candidatus Dojkabacteria bacterium]MDQ7020936.1 F0F1 ATP synthase subunit delta [Candidatus Dojkabacteria bacterium]
MKNNKEEKDQKKNIITLVAAHKISSESVKIVKEKFGEDYEIKEIIDASLLGGIIVKSDKKIFDGSVKTKLQNLHESLKK